MLLRLTIGTIKVWVMRPKDKFFGDFKISLKFPRVTVVPTTNIIHAIAIGANLFTISIKF